MSHHKKCDISPVATSAQRRIWFSWPLVMNSLKQLSPQFSTDILLRETFLTYSQTCKFICKLYIFDYINIMYSVNTYVSADF